MNPRVAAILVVTLSSPAFAQAPAEDGAPPAEEPPTEAADGPEAQTGDDGEYDPHGVQAVRTEGLDDEAARARFRVGMALYESGRFTEAADEFQRAYDLSQRGSLLFNAYLAYRDAGNLEAAVNALSGYLEIDRDAEDAARLRHRLEAMQRTLEEQQAARAEEDRRAEEERQRLAREAEEQRLAAERERQRAEAAENRLNPTGWIIGGIGVGVMALAAVPGALSRTSLSELEDNCPDDRCVVSNDFDLEALRSEANRRGIVADVMLFTGAAITIAGIATLFIRGGSSPSDDGAASEPEVSAFCSNTGCVADLRVGF